jgi:hypothetical protein
MAKIILTNNDPNQNLSCLLFASCDANIGVQQIYRSNEGEQTHGRAWKGRRGSIRVLAFMAFQLIIYLLFMSFLSAGLLWCLIDPAIEKSLSFSHYCSSDPVSVSVPVYMCLCVCRILAGWWTTRTRSPKFEIRLPRSERLWQYAVTILCSLGCMSGCYLS